jgi:hypothetical protein
MTILTPPVPSGIPKWSASPSPAARPSVSSISAADSGGDPGLMARSTLQRQRLGVSYFVVHYLTFPGVSFTIRSLPFFYLLLGDCSTND